MNKYTQFDVYFISDSYRTVKHAHCADQRPVLVNSCTTMIILNAIIAASFVLQQECECKLVLTKYTVRQLAPRGARANKPSGIQQIWEPDRNNF